MVKAFKPYILTKLNKKPGTQLKALFIESRKRSDRHYHGDYPLLSEIVRYYGVSGIQLSRAQIRRALNSSEELSNYSKKLKSDLLDNLQNVYRYELEKYHLQTSNGSKLVRKGDEEEK